MWISIGAWIGAAVVAVVVLGFCAYEIVWKARRLQADLGELTAVTARMTELQSQLAATQQRLAATGLR